MHSKHMLSKTLFFICPKSRILSKISSKFLILVWISGDDGCLMCKQTEIYWFPNISWISKWKEKCRTLVTDMFTLTNVNNSSSEWLHKVTIKTQWHLVDVRPVLEKLHSTLTDMTCIISTGRVAAASFHTTFLRFSAKIEDFVFSAHVTIFLDFVRFFVQNKFVESLPIKCTYKTNNGKSTHKPSRSCRSLYCWWKSNISSTSPACTISSTLASILASRTRTK